MKVYELMKKLSECQAGDDVVFDSVMDKREVAGFDEERGMVRVFKQIEELEDLGNGAIVIS